MYCVFVFCDAIMNSTFFSFIEKIQAQTRAGIKQEDIQPGSKWGSYIMQLFSICMHAFYCYVK